MTNGKGKPVGGDLSWKERREIGQARFDSRYKTLSPEMKEVLEGVPQKYKRLFVDVVTGNGNRTKGIKLKCYECGCWNLAQVKTCETVDCGLFHFRP